MIHDDSRVRSDAADAPVVVVTGSTRGIGLAIAKRFLRDGTRVVFHGRGAPADAEAQRAIEQGWALAVAADLAHASGRERLFRDALERFQRIDVLVNNAGVQAFGALADCTGGAFDHMLQVNVVAATDCMRHAFAAMARRADGGSIVNVASVRALRPGAGAALYAASKAALLAVTRAAAVEFGAKGVRVNAVLPGLVWREDIESEWADGVASYESLAPLRRIGKPEDVAEACAFLASAGAGWVTGAELVVDGGISLVR